MRYAERITEVLTRLGYDGIDPRHVEGYMRVEHGTLDGLTQETFAAEVGVALCCIVAAGNTESEAVAQSFGL